VAERSHNREGGHGAIAPIYARLPRGPHQMGRGEVAENQRQRMQGAMVEAVGANGYGGTSVRQVVSLAGVSRRAFYEQFTNKQDCFLETLDLVAEHATAQVEQAYRSTGPDLSRRMRAALTAYVELIATNPKSAHLVMIDAPSAGAPGWERLTKMLLAFEDMLSASFAHTRGAIPLPAPVVRGIAGGLYRIALIRLRHERTDEMRELVDDMLSWTLSFQAAAVMRLDEGIDARMTGTVSSADGASRIHRRGRVLSRPHGGPRRIEPERLRMLESALEMAALEGYENLSPLRIVDHAGVSIDAFFSQFGDLEKCFQEALLRLVATIHASVLDPGLASEEWPLAVPRALRALMGHFAANPTHAHTIATGTFEMGQSAIDLDMSLADGIARRLTQGAPGESPPIVRQAIAGAIWHTIYCHAASQQVERLPAVADHLAYIVLAPAIGAERALAILTKDRAQHHESRQSTGFPRTSTVVAAHAPL
jgi:AcrR family transcriptional regulator